MAFQGKVDTSARTIYWEFLGWALNGFTFDFDDDGM